MIYRVIKCKCGEFILGDDKASLKVTDCNIDKIMTRVLGLIHDRVTKIDIYETKRTTNINIIK